MQDASFFDHNNPVRRLLWFSTLVWLLWSQPISIPRACSGHDAGCTAQCPFLSHLYSTSDLELSGSGGCMRNPVSAEVSVAGGFGAPGGGGGWGGAALCAEVPDGAAGGGAAAGGGEGAGGGAAGGPGRHVQLAQRRLRPGRHSTLPTPRRPGGRPWWAPAPSPPPRPRSHPSTCPLPPHAPSGSQCPHCLSAGQLGYQQSLLRNCRLTRVSWA